LRTVRTSSHLIGLGRRDDAIAAVERAVRLDPASWSLPNTLGVVYSLARQPELAIRADEAALALRPDHPMVLDNLAMAYSDMGPHAEAIRTAERARVFGQSVSQRSDPFGTDHLLSGQRSLLP